MSMYHIQLQGRGKFNKKTNYGHSNINLITSEKG